MKTYKGHTINRAGPNMAGIRWTCYTGERFLKADTLEGIKKLINNLEG